MDAIWASWSVSFLCFFSSEQRRSSKSSVYTAIVTVQKVPTNVHGSAWTVELWAEKLCHLIWMRDLDHKGSNRMGCLRHGHPASYVVKLCVYVLSQTRCMIEEHKCDIITVLLCRFYGALSGHLSIFQYHLLVFSFFPDVFAKRQFASSVKCNASFRFFFRAFQGFNSLSCPFSRSPLSIFAAAAWMAIILAVRTALLTATIWFHPETCFWPIWLRPFCFVCLNPVGWFCFPSHILA